MGRIGKLIERERKYHLTEAEARALEEKLRIEGANERHEIQESIIFRDQDDRQKKDTILRLRTVDGKRELTFKGPKQTQGLDKWREELNVEIGDGPILDVLGSIGFRPVIRYRKDSRIFDFEGVLVSIDRLSGLGAFCEIEVPDLEHDLDAVAKDLGLDEARFEPRGYPTMAANAAKEKA